MLLAVTCSDLEPIEILRLPLEMSGDITGSSILRSGTVFLVLSIALVVNELVFEYLGRTIARVLGPLFTFLAFICNFLLREATDSENFRGFLLEKKADIGFLDRYSAT